MSLDGTVGRYDSQVCVWMVRVRVRARSGTWQRGDGADAGTGGGAIRAVVGRSVGRVQGHGCGCRCGHGHGESTRVERGKQRLDFVERNGTLFEGHWPAVLVK